MVRLFHITSNENAKAIFKDGFSDNRSYFRSNLVEVQDGFGEYRPDAEYTGVWVSDAPFERDALLYGHTLLAIEIPMEDGQILLPEFQWCEEGELFAKWLIPAAILNSYGPPMMEDLRERAEDYDEMQASDKEWRNHNVEAGRPNNGPFSEVWEPLTPGNWTDKPNYWMDK